VPAPKPAGLSLGGPSFSILFLKIDELEKYLVVAGCTEMWLRMHRVPQFPPAKKQRTAVTDVNTAASVKSDPSEKILFGCNLVAKIANSSVQGFFEPVRKPRCSRVQPQGYFNPNISCSFCVASTRTPTTHHIILAAPDGSEHSETEIRLVSLDKDVLTYLATLASRRLFFRSRHAARN